MKYFGQWRWCEVRRSFDRECIHQFITTMAIARWESFFKDAGIPTGPASDYAVIFSDNRMRMDMLNELNKGILADLGINIMGDVIAILRHSKKVYAEISRSAAEEFDVNRTKSNEEKKRNSLYSDLKVKQGSERIDSDKKSASAAVKLIGKTVTEKRPKPVDKSTILLPTSKEKPARKSLSARFGDYNPPLTKKRREKDEVITISVPLSEPTSSRKAPVKEKRLAAKEKEPVVPSKKTVFDRLGSASSETTSANEKPSLSATTVTASTKRDQKVSNVFSRLGESPATASTESTKQGGLSSRFSNLTSTKHSIQRIEFSPEPVLTVSVGKDDSTRLGLRGSHSVLRPIKHVKPIPRKPLAMDLEAINQGKQTKQGMANLEIPSKSQSVRPKVAKLEIKTSSKSVFDRLGQ